MHKVCLDAPMGSSIILTEEQYRRSQGKREELNRRYYDKIHKMAEGKDKALVLDLAYR